MRRTLLVLSVLAALVPLGLSSPAEGGDDATLNITKVVDGDGPTGGFVIQFSCTNEEGGGVFAFDAAGPGQPETQTVAVAPGTTCTVEETDSNGADSVAYECSFSVPVRSAPAEGLAGACIDDQTVLFESSLEEATITVTNTFDPAVLPDDTTPDVAPDVVAATPAFTG